MKRNFLLTLLLTILPLVGLAQQVVPAGGDYAATLGLGVGYNVNRPYVLTGQGLPLVTGITDQGDPVTGTVIPAVGTENGASPANYKVYKKETGGMVAVDKHNGTGDDALPVGNYWLQFQIETSQKLNTIYVPFQVYMEGTYDYIDSEESFNASVAGTDCYGGLKLYYADEDYQGVGIYQDFDNGTSTGNPSWAKAAGWGQPKHNSGTGFPWIVPVAPNDENSYKCLFLYKGTYTQPWEESSRSIFSKEAVQGTGTSGQISRQYGVVSVNAEVDPGVGEFVINPGNDFGPEGLGLYKAPTPVYADPANPTPGTETGWIYTETYDGEVTGFGFDRSKFSMFWMPADDMGDLVDPVSVDRTDISGGTAQLPTAGYTYNGAEQKPIFFDGSTTGLADSRFYATSTTTGDPLILGTDFTVSYPYDDDDDATTNYTDAGNTKPIVITGIGKYKGTRNVTYAILPKTLSATNFKLDPAAEDNKYGYTGADVKPNVLGYSGFEMDDTESPAVPVYDLEEGTDFTVELYKGTETTPLTGENRVAKNVGEYYYKVIPTGNFTDGNNAIALNFSVTGKDLSNFAVTLPTVNVGGEDVPGFIYNTEVQKPIFTGANANASVTAVAGSTAPLVEGTDFTVRYLYDEDNDAATDYIKIGSKPYIIEGIGNYSGSIGNMEQPLGAPTYRIVAKNIDNSDVAEGSDAPKVIKTFVEPTYKPDGNLITADNFKFTYNGKNLVLAADSESEGDFTWAWDKSSINRSDYESDEEYQEALEEYETSAGEKTITVTGKGNYTGTASLKFTLKACTVTITPADASKVYGEPDPAPNFTVDANSDLQIEWGSDEWLYIQSFLTMERDVNEASNYPEVRENVLEGGHKYICKKKEYNAADCNYEIIIQNANTILNIYPAPVTVYVANNSKTYGDPDPSFIADKSATDKFKITKPNPEAEGEPIDITDSKDFVDQTKNLKDVLNISRKPGEDVKTSPYDFTWDNKNYTVTFSPKSFTINQKHVTIAVTFGDEDYKGVPLKPTPTVIANGSIELVPDVDFIVDYFDGSANGNTTRDVTVGDNRTTWPKATVKEPTEFAGNYDFTASNNNYWKIIPATLKIAAIADNKKVYGESDPTPLAKVTFAQGYGPLGDDYYDYNTDGSLHSNFDILPSLLVRTGDDHVGTYVISVNPNATTRNYIIEGDATAKFHIYRSESTFTIAFTQPAVYTYGDTPDLTELVTVEAPTGYSGKLTADLLAYAQENVRKYQMVEGEKTYIETNNAGTYTLTIDEAPTTFANYDVIVDEGILTINPFPLYIISNGSKEYGAEEPDYEWGVYEKRTDMNGNEIFVLTTKDDFEVYEEEFIGNSDRLNNLGRYTISRAQAGTTAGENVGKYTTTIRNWRNTIRGRKEYDVRVVDNYSFQFHEGIFEITLRDLAVSVTGNSKIYGNLDPVKELVKLEPRTEEEGADNIEMFTKGYLRIQVTNALPNDVEAIANKVNYSNRTAGEVVTAIGYAVNSVTFNGKTNPDALNPDDAILRNYRLSSYSKNTQFMIEKRVLKVIAHDQSVPYANPLVVDPYDLTIVESILTDGVANVVPVDVNYDDIVTFMGPENNPKINDRVDQVFKPLEVAEGKTAVGKFHKDAFVLALTDAAKQNYEIELTNGKLYIEQLNDLYLDMANLAQTLEDHKGRTVNVHMVGATEKEEGCDPFRQFARNIWYTFVLPFSAMPREIVAPFRYGVIDILKEDNTNAGSFSLAITTKRVPANTPFIIQNDKSMTYADMVNVMWENVTIDDEFDYLNEDPTAKDDAGNKFIGTYKPKSDFTAANYIMSGNTGKFFRFIAGDDGVEPSYAMKQTEAYLESANPAAAARIFIDEEDGSTTAINFVGADSRTSTMDAEGWYTVDGMKMNAAPTQKGIYIKDGKKVFIQK